MEAGSGRGDQNDNLEGTIASDTVNTEVKSRFFPLRSSLYCRLTAARLRWRPRPARRAGFERAVGDDFQQRAGGHGRAGAAAVRQPLLVDRDSGQDVHLPQGDQGEPAVSCAASARRRACRRLPSLATQCKASPLAQVFEEVYETYKRQTGGSGPPRNLAPLERSAQTAASEAVTSLERRLTWLATIGAISPFVGLFGTVIGHCGRLSWAGDGGSGNAAGRCAGHLRGADHHRGGLFVAIPAVVAYNQFTARIRVFAAAIDDFCRELLNSLEEIPVRATGVTRRAQPSNPPGRWTVAFTSSSGQTRSSLAEINITPLVDVVLVLLVIFMITAPVLQSGIEVAVPKTRTVREITEQRLVVTIDRDQRVFLGDQPVNIHELAGRLRQPGAR